MFPMFVLFHVPRPNPRSPFPVPCSLFPVPRSVLLRITSPCSIFVPMLFCPNPCPFPLTLLCSFWYLYVDSFLHVPQSEINIDCPLWTSVRLIQTFRIHQDLHPSKLRTRERQEAKHQSLSRVLVEPYHWPSSSVVPESFRLPCSVSVLNRHCQSNIDPGYQGCDENMQAWGSRETAYKKVPIHIELNPAMLDSTYLHVLV